jgi:thimet oligopeptidase
MRELRPYLAYERVRDGLFQIAGRMFGFDFVRVTDVPVWHPSVEVYDVFEDKRRIGRLYLDTHDRPGKGDVGAWSVPARFGIAGVQLPELVLVARLPGGQPGDPGLMGLGNVRTFFHEFGHILHGLSMSGAPWLGRSRSTSSREHEFFEISSQLLEEWVTNPGVLATFARHYQTGEPVPPSLIRALQRTEQFLRGAGVRNEAVRARFALSLHDRNPDSLEPNELYRDIFTAYVPTPFHDGRYFPASYQRLRNAGAATHYSYLWAEVIVKDLFSQFDRTNLLDPTVARRYKETVLAPGTSKPGAELVRDFLGRPYNVSAWENWLNEGRSGSTFSHWLTVIAAPSAAWPASSLQERNRAGEDLVQSGLIPRPRSGEELHCAFRRTDALVLRLARHSLDSVPVAPPGHVLILFFWSADRNQSREIRRSDTILR